MYNNIVCIKCNISLYLPTTGEKPYRCTMEACEKAFAQLSNLQNHMKQHEKELNPGGRSSGGDQKKPYSCHVCQRRFATDSSLNNHVAKVRPMPTLPPALKQATYLYSYIHTLPSCNIMVGKSFNEMKT